MGGGGGTGGSWVLAAYLFLNQTKGQKRKDVLNYLKSKNFSIYCLQDAHFRRELKPYIQPQWSFVFI